MKLAVIGSRSFCSYEWLEQCLLRSFRVADIEAVISGILQARILEWVAISLLDTGNKIDAQ